MANFEQFVSSLKLYRQFWTRYVHYKRNFYTIKAKNVPPTPPPSLIKKRVMNVKSKRRPVRRPLAGGAGGGQDFEKLDQNLKFPQIVKKGGKEGEIHINEYSMMTNVPVWVRFWKKNREFLGLIFAKFDQILASFR